MYGQSGELYGVGRSLENNNNDLKFKGTSKNKNIDHRGKKDCANESDHISFLRDSTMSSALNFCFLSILLQPKWKMIWRKINSKNKNIYMWNQYYYLDLSKIGVGRAHTTKK